MVGPLGRECGAAAVALFVHDYWIDSVEHNGFLLVEVEVEVEVEVLTVEGGPSL